MLIDYRQNKWSAASDQRIMRHNMPDTPVYKRVLLKISGEG